MRDLKQAIADTVEPALDREIEQANAQEPHRFSASHMRDMQRVTGQRGITRHTVHAGWRAACILFAAAFLCGAAWQSERVRGIFMRNSGGKPTLTVTSEPDDPQTILQYYVLGDLPAGFRQTLSERNAACAWTNYENGNQLLMLIQCVKSAYHDVDTGGLSVSAETVDGTEYLVISPEDSRQFNLIWEGDDYVFLLVCSGDIDQDDAIELCKSLKAAK